VYRSKSGPLVSALRQSRRINAPVFVAWLTWARALPARCNLQSFAQFISRPAVAVP